MSHNVNGSIRDSATDWIIDNAICADPPNKPTGVIEEKDRHVLDEWQDDHYTTRPDVTVVNPIRQDDLPLLRNIAVCIETSREFGEIQLITSPDTILGVRLLTHVVESVLRTPQAWVDFRPDNLRYIINLLETRHETLARGLIPTSLTPPVPKKDRVKFPKVCDSRKGRREACINASEGLTFEQAKTKFLLLGLGSLIDEKDESSVICPSCKIAPETLVGIANPRVS